MSASMPETSIFALDPPDVVKKKVWNAFTGGKGTAAEQRKLGLTHQYVAYFSTTISF